MTKKYRMSVFEVLAKPLVFRPGDVLKDPACVQRGLEAYAKSKKNQRFQEFANPWGLSATEFAGVSRMAQGFNLTEAADWMCLSPKTLATLMQRARRKMSARNNIQAVLTFDRQYNRPDKVNQEFAERLVVACGAPVEAEPEPA